MIVLPFKYPLIILLNMFLPTEESTADNGSSNKYKSASLYTALANDILAFYPIVIIFIIFKYLLWNLNLYKNNIPPLILIPLSPISVISEFGNSLKSYSKQHNLTI